MPEEENVDLIQLFTQSIDTMSDEEIVQQIQQLRKLRATRISVTRKKDPLDEFLTSLSVDQAQQVLERFSELDKKEESENVDETSS